MPGVSGHPSHWLSVSPCPTWIPLLTSMCGQAVARQQATTVRHSALWGGLLSASSISLFARCCWPRRSFA